MNKRIAVASRLIGQMAAEAVLEGMRRAGAKGFACFAAVVSVESGGRAVYGGADGAEACLSGFPLAVDASNWQAFWWEVDRGRSKSNGVNIYQTTYKPYFDQMLARDLRPWVPADCAEFTIGTILAPGIAKHGKRQALAMYNGGTRPGERAYRYADEVIRRELVLARGIRAFVPGGQSRLLLPGGLFNRVDGSLQAAGRCQR